VRGKAIYLHMVQSALKLHNENVYAAVTEIT